MANYNHIKWQLPLLTLEKYSLLLLSFQPSTDTKSATMLGTTHFNNAEFPFMM